MRGRTGTQLTVEAVKKIAPRSVRPYVNQELIDRLNSFISDPIIAETFRDSFMSCMDVFKVGKFKFEDYVNATKFVSCKLLGYTNQEAYAATFPERYAHFKRYYSGDKLFMLDKYCQRYGKSKIVSKIFEQTLIPTHILNAPLYQEAINELAKMVRDPNVKGMVKVKACEALLSATKAPEELKAKLTIGIEESDTLSDLRELTEQLASQFKGALESGTTSLSEIVTARIVKQELDQLPEESTTLEAEFEVER